jgi:hypothetical protein
MTMQSTKDKLHQRREEVPAADDGSGGGGGLLEQATAFANVSREAHRDCEKGKAAEKALTSRRNRPGQ